MSRFQYDSNPDVLMHLYDADCFQSSSKLSFSHRLILIKQYAAVTTHEIAF